MLKNKSGIIALTLVSTLIFSGCTTEKNEGVPESETPVTAIEKPVSGVEETDEAATGEPFGISGFEEVSEGDQAMLSAAVDLADSALCEKISQANVVEVCKATVSKAKEDQAIAIKTSNAVVALDGALCQEIAEESYRDICVARVNAEVEREKVQKTLQAELQAGANEVQAIVEGGDISQCETIEDSNWKSDCIFNITVDKAIEAENLTLCEDLNNQDQKDRCIDAVKRVAEAAIQ